MRIRQKKYLALFIPVLVVVALDQLTKYWIRTNPVLHDYTVIKGVLSFHYTQNPGMALGMQWAATPVISVVAIIATLLIMLYIYWSIDRAKVSYLVCMGLILGGAIGNIIDRLIMGIIGGYASVLGGHVVDFIHFTLEINDFAVFPYIFNVADMAISVSLIILLIFHNRLLARRGEEKEESPDKSTDTPDKTAGFEPAESGNLEESDKSKHAGDG